VKCTVLAASPEWKEYTQRPALHFILRILNGLLNSHSSAQLQVNEQAVHLLHGLEQLSSDSHVGSLAETLLETICQQNEQRDRVLQVRRETREEKKRLAMAGRQKQLGALGMRANEHGQVTAESCIWKQVEDLGDEQGLICCICREGYKFQPIKVLGIYTFSKRCTLEPFESKMRKAKGYFTVTHFNVVHVDCHLAAVRHARARDEWESAALQNGNTRCNGLLPMWGPSVCDMAFAGSFLRHNVYLQECTALRELGYSYTIHDLKLLLLRFAQEQSFSTDSGGGGPQSNVHLIPYLMHAALYVMNSSTICAKESARLHTFLEEPNPRHIQGAFELENVHYLAVLHTLVLPRNIWSKHRLDWLRRLVVVAQARHSAPTGNIQWLPDVQVQAYSVYKPTLVFFALIDNMYSNILKVHFFDYFGFRSQNELTIFCFLLQQNVQCDANKQSEQWPTQLAQYIRNNDQKLVEQTDKLLEFYQNDVLPCTSFEEFCDVCGLLSDISQPAQFLQETLFNYVNPTV
jgi:E3 ubiquitin-protein ligase UBR4